jgi:hypothetical protein
VRRGSATYSKIALGARILPPAGEGGANDGRDGVLASGSGQVPLGRLGDGGSGGADEAAFARDMVDDGVLDDVLDGVPLDLDRHGSWRSIRHPTIKRGLLANAH